MVSFSTFLILVGVSSTFGRVLKSNSLSDHGQWNPVRQRPVRQATCTTEYSEVSGSTMCLEDSPNYIEGSAGITTDNQNLIVKLHNDYRSGVNPTATKMPKLYWDNELAKLAEKWAKQCKRGHEGSYGYSRLIPAYGMTPGQNAGRGYSDWTHVVGVGWYDEVEDFALGTGSTNGKTVGHYTQVVHDLTFLIGCGYAECENDPYKRYYICNYLKGQSSFKNPYKSGTSCSGCSEKCSDNLCDCGGKFCFNGGTLNLNTCKCSCRAPFTGATCQ